MKILAQFQQRYLLVCLTLLLAQSADATQSIANKAEPADKEYEVAAVLWQQASGEHRALCYQSFALARMLLDRDLRNRGQRQRRAVIVDVDDTMLDNSRYQAAEIKQHFNYPQGWTEWINRAEATAVPGALEFLQYADSRGVRVFYVTNRKQIEKDGTARNLKQFGFPKVNDETLLVRTDPKSDTKEPRRRAIMSKYHVVLLMGDDLNDFGESFENSRTVTSRIDAAEQNKSQFGTRFIVLPNPMYGDWENSIYDYNFKLTEEAKAQKRRSLLRD
jgi:5'-nucleotidase (lipoprotein e(P4) family)